MKHTESISTPQYATVNTTFQVETDSEGNPCLILTQNWASGVNVSTHRIVVTIDAFDDFHSAYLRAAGRMNADTRAYSVSDVRRDYPNAYRGWTPDDDQRLLDEHAAGHTIKELADMFGRQRGAIESCLAKLT
ncbi:hypothetical protein LF1_57820 [Rubripirellula obstinata]|uniref:Uncharacterized protein n=1 Tax=Rubripirellula obstinata TaxID=406547 RepID=A0A5B1C8I1_9BACT|nr:hypothetical protein [Rubripirellula obstinata]KAA1256816.1 hypothetical protein LF1_58900 [Rubripirellula obstinata]KAA1256894.1 hypothetical protein LF1_58020 [Rubripirellula obstinata]KAA1256927.1 hypothetical protein LF1_57820 [Rubripirellula obstinata]